MAALNDSHEPTGAVISTLIVCDFIRDAKVGISRLSPFTYISVLLSLQLIYREKSKLPVLILLLLTTRITGQSLDPVADFPVEFKDRAMEHVTRISSFGERVAGTKAATKNP